MTDNKYNVTDEIFYDSNKRGRKPKSTKQQKIVTEQTKSAINDELRFIYNNVGRYPVLTNEETRKLFIDYKKNGNLEARELLIASNMRIVVRIARKWENGRNTADLIQEGIVGLIEAIERFDVSKDVTFCTYASTWIVHSISKQSHALNSQFYIPLEKSRSITKMYRAEVDFEIKNKRKPTNEELAILLNTTTKVIENNKKYSGFKFLSLDFEHTNQSGGKSFAEEIITDENKTSDIETVKTNELIAQMIGFMDALDKRERKILELRFGFNNEESMKLNEVAEIFGVSQERIRQIEKVAILKLRKAMTGDDE